MTRARRSTLHYHSIIFTLQFVLYFSLYYFQPKNPIPDNGASFSPLVSCFSSTLLFLCIPFRWAELERAGACSGDLHLPLEPGARKQRSPPLFGASWVQKSAPAPRTSPSMSQPVSGAPHRASGKLVHELGIHNPPFSHAVTLLRHNPRQWASVPVSQSPLRSRSMHVHDDAWGRTSGNASSIDVRRAAACSRRTPVLVVSSSLPALPRSYGPWLAGGVAVRPTPPPTFPPQYERRKLEPSFDPENSPSLVT